MNTFLSVDGNDLLRLSSSNAVKFFHKLLCAEATTLGLGLPRVNVPYNITASDGGIDAEVTADNISGGHGIIFSALTRYQIKTGAFSLAASQVKEILLSDTGEIKPRIKTCLDQDGTLVVVLFGSDNPEQQDGQVIAKFIEILKTKDAKYENAKIKIWRQNQIISFLEPFPSLRLALLGRGDMPFYDHDSWKNLADMRYTFHEGEAQKEYISNLKKELEEIVQPVHIRVIGEPGLGKTRLMMEATGDEKLAPLVIYCESPKQLLDSPLITHIQRTDNTFQAILVVDECDADSRTNIWSKLESVSPRIKLVTIHNEIDDSTGKTKYLNPPLLDEKQIQDIIAGYGFPTDQVRRWVEYCSGSPRVAHVIGQNLKENPEDLTKSPDIVNVWDRYIAGRDDLNGQMYVNRKKVLRWLSLFKKFGYAFPLQEEAKLIGAKIEQEESIRWRDLQTIIDDLRRRKILQGNTTLYITPKLLHIKLWTEWWQKYGSAEDFKLEEFTVIDATSTPPKVLNETMIGWFCDMFRYARASEAASRVVTELLGENGPFQNSDLLKERLGADFFLALTEANPEASLKCLQKTVGTWDRDHLLNFKTGRREVVWSLEKIAIWKNTFKDATRLLLLLADAENETYSNNATGVFTDLFSAGYGELAVTELSAVDRLPVLFEALDSDSKVKRLIGIKASDKALETQNFSRDVGAEFQGLRKKPELWKPKTYGEIFAYYEAVWKYLVKKIDDADEEERNEIVKVLLNNFRGLIHIKSLYSLVITTFNDLYTKGLVSQKDLLRNLTQIFHYEKALPEDVSSELEVLKGNLEKKDFSSRLKRYVGMNLLEDIYDADGKRTYQVNKNILDLVQEVIDDPSRLDPELSWLVSDEAENGYIFGYELGKKDQSFSLLPGLFQAIKGKNKSLYFIGGYFKALFEASPKKWETILDDVSKDKELQSYLAELTWRSGMSDQAAKRILDLANDGILISDNFRIFGLGSVIRDLSEDIFQKWIEFLLAQNDRAAVSIALDLYDFFYNRKEAKYSLPKDLTIKLLAHPKLFEKTNDRYDTMDDFHWKEIGQSFVSKYPKESLDIAKAMIPNLGEEGTILEGYHEPVEAVLNDIAKNNPKEVWNIITEKIKFPLDSAGYHIGSWLQGSKHSDSGTRGAFSYFNPESVWSWVESDKEKRSWFISHFAPKIFIKPSEGFCWAREILVRYGEKEDVRDSLVSDFLSEGWSGPASLHYEQKRQRFIDLRKDETDEKVINWLDDFIDYLGKQIELERIREERRGF